MDRQKSNAEYYARTRDRLILRQSELRPSTILEILDCLKSLDLHPACWHLTCDQVIVASPFVGHQFSKEEEQRNQWSSLLAQLDPKRTALITRPATFTAFKDLSDGDVTYDLLKRYELENKLVSANLKKQDFHAKFSLALPPRGARF